MNYVDPWGLDPQLAGETAADYASRIPGWSPGYRTVMHTPKGGNQVKGGGGTETKEGKTKDGPETQGKQDKKSTYVTQKKDNRDNGPKDKTGPCRILMGPQDPERERRKNLRTYCTENGFKQQNKDFIAKDNYIGLENDINQSSDDCSQCSSNDFAKQKSGNGEVSSDFDQASRPKQNVFPEDPNDFNPPGYYRKDYERGKKMKWHNVITKKAVYEWHFAIRPHYHKNLPNGKTHIPHPATGNTHIYAGDPIF
jgi:hypothetical protein